MYPAGLVEVASHRSLERLDSAARSHEGGEQSAGGGARSANALGVDAVLVGIGPQPADGSLAVVDECGKLGQSAQAVVHAGYRVTVMGQPADLGGLLGPAPPGSAVKEHHQLGFLVRFLARHMKVELKRDAVALGVFEIEKGMGVLALLLLSEPYSRQTNDGQSEDDYLGRESHEIAVCGNGLKLQPGNCVDEEFRHGEVDSSIGKSKVRAERLLIVRGDHFHHTYL